MELKEITLAELLNSTAGTDYFVTFAKLIGHGNESTLYEGITDESLPLLEELELKLGYEIPSNYIEFLNHLNGGHFFKMDLFSLTDKEYPNSLYNRNFINTIREDLELEDKILIIGKKENHILCIDCEDADGSYTLMDVRNKETITFESFNALIGFIFYLLVVNSREQLEKEKAQIQEMKEKLHEEIVKQKQQWKKEKERNSAKIRAKAAANGLKEKQRKSKKKMAFGG